MVGPSSGGAFHAAKHVIEPAYVIPLYVLALVGLFFAPLPLRVPGRINSPRSGPRPPNISSRDDGEKARHQQDLLPGAPASVTEGGESPENMWPYLLVFFAALAVDTIPVFAPPAWILLVVLLVKFKLNPWLTVAIGVAGSTVGRYILTRYIPMI